MLNQNWGRALGKSLDHFTLRGRARGPKVSCCTGHCQFHWGGGFITPSMAKGCPACNKHGRSLPKLLDHSWTPDSGLQRVDPREWTPDSREWTPESSHRLLWSFKKQYVAGYKMYTANGRRLFL